MTLPNTFANETSPGMIELDQNFAAVANMATWNATATGTNAIALTTTASQPAVSAYTDRQRFQFIGPNNSIGSVTVAVNSLAALPLYLITGVQAASGDVASGTPYTIIYLAALNSGGGGFQILSAVPSSAVTPATMGATRGLLVANNSATPNTKIDITAGQAVLVTTGGSPKFIASPSVTIDLTTTGANGMDTGARPTSGWVYCYLISNGSVTAGLASATSPTAGNPTFPGGYTYYGYVGAMYCDGSQNLLRTRQRGREAQYVVTAATNTANMPQMILGAAGSISNPTPTWVAVAVGTFVPASAGAIIVHLLGSGSGGGPIAAPNNSYAGAGSGTNPPPLSANTAGATGPSIGFLGQLILESANIYYACGNTTPNGMYCFGWTDYYSTG